jgi:transposase
MRTGRPRKPLEISEEDRGRLSLIARRPKSSQAMALRARIILSCEQGMSNAEVARKLHITGATVGKWRERFRELGFDGLLDEPRVGAPRKITDEQIEEVVTRTLESIPANSTHWSTRLMADETGLSQNAIACGSGMLSDCSRIVWKTSSFLKIHTSWRKCGTSWACT